VRRHIAYFAVVALVSAAVAYLLVKTTPTPPSGSVPLRAPDGGPSYYAAWPKSLSTDPAFFPVGVWLESVTSQADVDQDKGAGLNTYVGITANSDLPLVNANGMKVIPQYDEWVSRANAPGSQSFAGWMLSDEIDMQQGPGQGYTTQSNILTQLPANDGRIRYSNYGKGVTFWESDADAAKFVNNYQDVVSADNYWFTDNNICGASEGGALLNGGRALSSADCHRAANYGKTIDRLRNLVSPAGSKPVWAFVELGHPFTESTWPSITPAQVKAAVWSSLIHGARGVVYFNHSFGGPYQTQHILRDPNYTAIRAAVAETDARIKALAPVLNASFADGFVTTADQVDVMAKYYNGSYYVFAGSRTAAAQTASLNIPCSGSMTVLDENRTLNINNGKISDTFADGNAFHIYKVDNGGTCPAPR
jgi:hypothetical protein